MWRILGLKDSVFGVFYILNEGPSRRNVGQWQRRWSILLLMLDSGQVLRHLINSRYGWSSDLVNVTNTFDIVRVLTSLIPNVVPRVIFYVAAHALVLTAVVDTAYVAHLFRNSNLKQMWPVKILRFLVAGLVTTFFASVLGWMLYPADCVQAADQSFSALMHGPGAPCSPWGSPEAAATLPSVVLAAVFVAFSLMTTLLSFEVNPLSQAVRASCTGRVETLWNIVRTLCIILGLLSYYITPFLVAAVILLLSAALMRAHLAILPFHSHAENMCRGGIYCAVCWTAMASLAVSAMGRLRSDGAPAPSWLVFLQWTLIGGIPLVFVGGLVSVKAGRRHVAKRIERIRRDWQAGPAASAAEPHASSARRRSMPPSANVQSVIQGGAAGAPPAARTGSIAGPASLFDHFFDSEQASNRLFKNALDALLVIRVLLYQRDKGDIPFLLYLIQKGLDEYPDNEDLIIFNLLMKRVLPSCDTTTRTMTQQKLTEALNPTTLSLDRQYSLYSADRSTFQQAAGANLGKDSVNALQLLEFNLKLEKVQAQHRDCIYALKAFWNALRRSGRELKQDAEHVIQQVGDLFAFVEKIRTSTENAHDGYRDLLEKFPRSTSVLRSYASFCDVILNKYDEAIKLRHRAEVFESSALEDCMDDLVSANDDILAHLDQKDDLELGTVKSATSSSNEGGQRARAQRYFETWRDTMMGRDLSDLNLLRWRIFLAVLLIVVISTVGFCLTDMVLFGSIAQTVIDLDRKGRDFRPDIVDTNFIVRSIFLAAVESGERATAALRDNLAEIATSSSQQNLDNYQSSPSGISGFYQDPRWTLYLPIGDSWIAQRTTFWSLGNEFTSRAAAACNIRLADIINQTKGLHDLPASARGAAFLLENSFRTLIPAYEELSVQYNGQVDSFGSLTHALVWVNVSVNIMIILLVACFVLQALEGVIRNVQHHRVIILAAITAPKPVAKKLYTYYHEAACALLEIEDGEDVMNFHEENDGASRHILMSETGSSALGQRGHEFQDMQEERQVRGNTGDHQQIHERAITHLSNENRIGSHRAVSRSFRLYLKHSVKSSSLRRSQFETTAEHGSEFGKHFSSDLHHADTETKPPSSPAATNPPYAERKLLTKENLITHVQRSPWPSSTSIAVLDIEDQSKMSDSESLVSLPTEYHGLSESSSPRDHTHSEHLGHKIKPEEEILTPPSLKNTGEPPGHPEPLLQPAQHKTTPIELMAFPEKDTLSPPPLKRFAESLRWVSTNSMSKAATKFPYYSEERGSKLNMQPAVLEVQSSLLSSPHRSEGSESKSLTGPSEKEYKIESLGRNSEFSQGKPQLTIRAKTAEPLQAESGRIQAESKDEDQGNRTTNIKVQVDKALQNHCNFALAEHGNVIVKRQMQDSGVTSEDVFLDFRSNIKAPATNGLREEPNPSSQKRRSALIPRSISNAQAEAAAAETAAAADSEALRQIQLRAAARVSASLRRILLAQLPWYSQKRAHLSSLLLMLLLCVLGIVYPTRNLDALVNSPHLADQANRRRFLHMACVHFARELVLGDGLSRLNTSELAAGLRWALDSLKAADTAARLGGTLGVRAGADVGINSEVHNRWMYEAGCPWRSNATSEVELIKHCRVPSRPEMPVQGLHGLLLAFYDSCENVLQRYGPVTQDPEAASTKSGPVILDAERTLLLSEDADMVFILESYGGDLQTGLTAIMDVLDVEPAVIISTLHAEMRLLYAIFIAQACVVFYFLLFRRTVREATRQIYLVRKFIERVPAFELNREEVKGIRSFFDDRIYSKLLVSQAWTSTMLDHAAASAIAAAATQ